MKNINNLVQMLDSVSFAYAAKIAIVFGAKQITYRELLENSNKLASSLRGIGVKEFDKVAIWLPNCPEFVYAFFAVLKIRAVVVPINTMFKREEAKFIMEDCRAITLICSVDKVPESENILSRLDSLKNVVSLPAPKENTAVLDFYNLINGAEELNEKAEIKEDDLAEIVYTSGTTGKPKGACLSHKNLLSNVKDCSQIIKATKSDCFICVLPLFHSFASTVCMLLPLYRGAKIVIMRSVRPFKRVIRAIFKNRVTVFTGVPSIFNILSEANFPRLALLLNLFINPIRLCISGAAALPFEVWYKFEKRFKRKLFQGYGLTEASPVVSLNPLYGERRPESTGIALPSIKIKITDKDGNELPVGEIGELLVKGPNVMKGYFNLPLDTQKTLKDGWLYTGDLAKVDKNGFIYIMGRLKEMINVRGLNVYPREIEDALYKQPKIKEAAVVGVMHRHRGEAPIAFVVKKEEISEREIIRYLRDALASYKIPLRVIFKDSLPKNTTGKILKIELQKEVENIFK
ncbi:MAG: long-chain fatty acid--CoA ligase [Candidatus Omnitrophota bacterium]|jgi:long-chain acyl-CoA synthetase